MTALQTLLNDFRSSAKTEREKGGYFEELIVQYLKAEPAYYDQYSNVWPYAEWTRGEGMKYGRGASDEGIDLVAKTRGTGDYHAIPAASAPRLRANQPPHPRLVRNRPPLLGCPSDTLRSRHPRQNDREE